jgi:hypothetical protein
MEETEATREVVSEAKTTSDLLTRLQESLARAADKNDSLLEAIETTEARATREGQGGSELSLLRNLRARLAACHAPNSNIQRDLATVSDPQRVGGEASAPPQGPGPTGRPLQEVRC